MVATLDHSVVNAHPACSAPMPATSRYDSGATETKRIEVGANLGISLKYLSF